MNNSGGYDDGYRCCGCFWGSEPGSLIKLVAQYRESVHGSRVWDAGCGEGKNAIHLARSGASVAAWDISGYALRNAQIAWPDSHLVTWVHGDVQNAPLEKAQYDIVVMYGLLHCMKSREAIINFVRRSQCATVSKGLHVIASFNIRHQELHPHAGLNPTLLEHQDYLSMYDDWNVLHQSDRNLHETHPHNNIPHIHSMTRLIAEKP